MKQRESINLSKFMALYEYAKEVKHGKTILEIIKDEGYSTTEAKRLLKNGAIKVYRLIIDKK